MNHKIIFPSVLLFTCLVIVTIRYFDYHDEEYLDCMKNCNDTETFCHYVVKTENVPVDRYSLDYGSLITDSKNITICDISSDRFPNFSYVGDVDICLKNKEVDKLKCYHGNFTNIPTLNCQCLSTIHFLLIFFNSILIFCYSLWLFLDLISHINIRIYINR